jgi:hypothetical protein
LENAAPENPPIDSQAMIDTTAIHNARRPFVRFLLGLLSTL